MWKISTVMDVTFNAKAIRYFIAIFFYSNRSKWDVNFIYYIHPCTCTNVINTKFNLVLTRNINTSELKFHHFSRNRACRLW